MDKKQTEKRVEYLKLSSGEEIPVITLDIDHFCGTREANLLLPITILIGLGIVGILIFIISILNYPHIIFKEFIEGIILLGTMIMGLIYIHHKYY